MLCAAVDSFRVVAVCDADGRDASTNSCVPVMLHLAIAKAIHGIRLVKTISFLAKNSLLLSAVMYAMLIYYLLSVFCM